MVPSISLYLVYNLNLEKNCVANCKSVAVTEAIQMEAMHKAVMEAMHKVMMEMMKKSCDRGYENGRRYFK